MIASEVEAVLKNFNVLNLGMISSPDDLKSWHGKSSVYQTSSTNTLLKHGKCGHLLRTG